MPSVEVVSVLECAGNGRARLDWMHLEDELQLGDQRDDLLSAALWQNLSEHLLFEGEYSHLEGDPRDLRLRAFYDHPESQSAVRVSGGQLLFQSREALTSWNTAKRNLSVADENLKRLEAEWVEMEKYRGGAMEKVLARK